jgi:hypothetical protein
LPTAGQHRFRQQLLQLGILVFQSLQFTGIRNVHPAKLGLVLVKGCLGDAVLAADIRRLHPGFLLTQYPDDLFLREP